MADDCEIAHGNFGSNDAGSLEHRKVSVEGNIPRVLPWKDLRVVAGISPYF